MSRLKDFLTQQAERAMQAGQKSRSFEEALVLARRLRAGGEPAARVHPHNGVYCAALLVDGTLNLFRTLAECDDHLAARKRAA